MDSWDVLSWRIKIGFGIISDDLTHGREIMVCIQWHSFTDGCGVGSMPSPNTTQPCEAGALPLMVNGIGFGFWCSRYIRRATLSGVLDDKGDDVYIFLNITPQSSCLARHLRHPTSRHNSRLTDYSPLTNKMAPVYADHPFPLITTPNYLKKKENGGEVCKTTNYTNPSKMYVQC